MGTSCTQPQAVTQPTLDEIQDDAACPDLDSGDDAAEQSKNGHATEKWKVNTRRVVSLLGRERANILTLKILANCVPCRVAINNNPTPNPVPLPCGNCKSANSVKDLLLQFANFCTCRWGWGGETLDSAGLGGHRHL